MNQPLTNQELLSELDKRVEDGSITVQINNKISTDPLTANLFNFRVSNEDGSNSATSTGLLSNKYLLLGLTIGTIIFLIYYQKKFSVDSDVEFLINQKN